MVAEVRTNPNTDNTDASITKLIGLRYLPLSIAVLIPYVGMIFVFIDPLFIFREERRCIHDFIAGTKVVNFNG